MQNRNVKMEVVNPNAAGIDVGSRSHLAAIGQGSGDIKEFGVYNEDLKQLTKWFGDNEIKTVAMESTGTYWQHLYIGTKDTHIKNQESDCPNDNTKSIIVNG